MRIFVYLVYVVNIILYFFDILIGNFNNIVGDVFLNNNYINIVGM